MTELNEICLQLKETTRKFTENEIVPIASELDRNYEDIPESIYKKMGELGYFGILIPEEYGGSGLDHKALVVVTEELSRGWLSVGSLIARNVGAGKMLMEYGTDEQKKKWLPLLASGEVQFASAGTEAEAGSDAANIKTKAEKRDKGWVINGTKMFCTNGHRANVLGVFAKTNPEAKPKHRGISLFCMEKVPGENFDPPRITGSYIPCVGYRGMKTWELSFEDVRVPEGGLLGPLNKGFNILMKMYETARIQFAARSIGVAQAAFDAALQYSKERIQFELPICKFQAIRFKLADMATHIELARQLTYHAAEKKDKGKRCDLEAGMAKLFASEKALEIAWDAIQILGGYGYTKEFPVERYWRDAGLLPIGEGTSEIQREVIARRLLGE